MSASNIELENGLPAENRKGLKLQWTSFSRRRNTQSQVVPHIDQLLRQRILEAITLDSFANGDLQTGLTACIDNILLQFVGYQSTFYDLIPVSFKDNARECDWFAEVLLTTWELARKPERLTLGSLVEELNAKGRLDMCFQIGNQQTEKLALQLGFFVVGCSTKLYRLRSNPLSLDKFQIDGYDTKTQNYHKYFLKTQVSEDGTQRPIRDFLQEFGKIPLRATQRPRDNSEPQAHEFIDPTTFNAKVFKNTLGMRIVWTTLLSAHLDYDDRSRSIFLFVFPSFCLANIPQGNFNNHVNLVQRCWTEASRPSTTASREMANYMKEVLLTTYMIFSQTKKARGFFRITETQVDPLLADLCQRDWPAAFQEWDYRPRRVYDIHDDFPIFGPRLRLINKLVLLSRPKGIKELWKDKRDTLQWYTFWAVVIIGGFGLVLSICQTALAAIQVWAIFHVH